MTIAVQLALSGGAMPHASAEPVPLQTRSPLFVALLVSDVPSAVTWYGDTFGLTVAKEVNDPNGRFKISILRSDEMVVELIEDSRAFALEKRVPDLQPGEKVLGIFKVGIEVVGLERLRDALAERDADLRGDIFVDAPLGQRSFLLLDPFGNRLQFFERIE